MRALFLCALCVLCGLSLSAQVLLRWEVDTAKSAPKILEVYQGETVNFEVSVRESGAVKVFPDTATAVFLWQTNGMGSAWWSHSAVVSGSVVRATWSPSNDVGSASYTWYVAIVDSATINYRVNGTLRIRDSPGFAPASLASPAIFEQLKDSLGLRSTIVDSPAALPVAEYFRSAYLSRDNSEWGNEPLLFVEDATLPMFIRVPEMDLAIWRKTVLTNAVFDLAGTTNQTVLLVPAISLNVSPIVGGIVQTNFVTYTGWDNGEVTNRLVYGTNHLSVFRSIARRVN